MRTTQVFQHTAATASTEGVITPLPNTPISGWRVAAASTAIRCRINRPLVISVAPTVYMYIAATGLWTAKTLPITLSGMTANDRLLVGVLEERIAALELVLDQYNGSASVLSCRTAPRADDITQIAAADWVVSAITDGTISGGCCFGQDGRILIANPLSVYPCWYTGNTNGRHWYDFRVSATLDASTRITAITALGEHFTVASGAAYPADGVEPGWLSRLYYRTDTGSGTLTLTGAY